eukprot:253055-Pelagomonas_calceolata.AAC.2
MWAVSDGLSQFRHPSGHGLRTDKKVNACVRVDVKSEQQTCHQQMKAVPNWALPTLRHPFVHGLRADARIDSMQLVEYGLCKLGSPNKHCHPPCARTANRRTGEWHALVDMDLWIEGTPGHADPPWVTLPCTPSVFLAFHWY